MTGRAANGRFGEGNRFGRGRPSRAVETDYLKRLADEVTLDDWVRIVLKARDDAIAGDAKARTWLASYLCGPPRDGALLDLAAAEEHAAYDEEESARERMQWIGWGLCPDCGEDVAAGLSTCSSCGSRLEAVSAGPAGRMNKP
jgi:hypothetical protein